LQVVREAMNLAAAAWFVSPVGPEVEGYHQVIASPMDLGTIAGNLEAGAYGSVAAVWRDIQQVSRQTHSHMCGWKPGPSLADKVLAACCWPSGLCVIWSFGCLEAPGEGGAGTGPVACSHSRSWAGDKWEVGSYVDGEGRQNCAMAGATVHHPPMDRG
jgi:Bromodomain